MNGIREFSEASGWIWGIIADHLWQSAILVVIAASICAIARQSPARIRYNIWLIAAVKLAVPSIGLAVLLLAIRPATGSGSGPAAMMPGQFEVGPVVYDLAQPLDRFAGSIRGATGQQWIFAGLSAIWTAGFVLTLGTWV